MIFKGALAKKTARGRGGKRLEKEANIAVATAAFGKKYGLSPREQDVLELLIGRVVSAEEIAQYLALSRNTVRIHVKQSMKKLVRDAKRKFSVCSLSSWTGIIGLQFRHETRGGKFS